MNLYKNENDTLYTLSQQTRDLINAHKGEINLKWKKIKKNRTLDNYLSIKSSLFSAINFSIKRFLNSRINLI